ncbi:MAG: hypothetical protein O2867_06140 [Bacteroidetes bacterium]|jgi:hypothetical protein|nr:hypothetical protein [Bacteroidota bacterium]
MASEFNKDWECIDSSADTMYIQLRMSMLQSAGLRAVILNRKDSVYNAFGTVELYVHRDDFLKAKHLLETDEEE